MIDFETRLRPSRAPDLTQARPSALATVFPYLPPLLQDGKPYYHHVVTLAPTRGATAARVVLERYAWTAGTEGSWKLVEIDPLELNADTETPYLVAGPLALNPECPQLWTVREARAASVSVRAVPRQSGLPTLELMPGAVPPEKAPYVLSLPPSMSLPKTSMARPCRIEVYPLGRSASFAFRLRLYHKGEPKGETPYLFHATVKSPKAWEISHGHKISEVDPGTGRAYEVVDATYESGDMGPALTVFSGSLLAVFMWRPDERVAVTNAAALSPEELPPDPGLSSRSAP